MDLFSRIARALGLERPAVPTPPPPLPQPEIQAAPAVAAVERPPLCPEVQAYLDSLPAMSERWRRAERLAWVARQPAGADTTPPICAADNSDDILDIDESLRYLESLDKEAEKEAMSFYGHTVYGSQSEAFSHGCID